MGNITPSAINKRFNAGNYEEAINDWTELLSLGSISNRSTSNIYLHRAEANFRLNRYKEAMSDCNEAVRLTPNIASPYSKRAKIFISYKSYLSAIEDCTKAICIGGMNYASTCMTYYVRAIARIHLKHYKQSIEDCDAAIGLLSINREKIYAIRASAKLALKYYEEAIGDTICSTSLNSTVALPFVHRAMAHLKLKRLDTAKRDCETAMKLNAKEGRAYVVQAMLHIELNEYKEALDNCATAFRLGTYRLGAHDMEAETYLTRAIIYFRLNRDREALLDLERVLKLDSGNTDAYNYRGLIYKKIALQSPAKEHFQELAKTYFQKAFFLERRADPEAKLYEALKNGQIDAAKECLVLIKEKQAETKESKISHTLSFNGSEPVLLTAATFGRRTLLPLVLEYCPIDVTDRHGNSALHYAAQSGQIGMIDALIDRGAVDLKEGKWPRNEEKWAPWHTAAYHGQAEALIHFQKKYLSKQPIKNSFDLWLGLVVPHGNILHLLVKGRYTAALEKVLTQYPNLPLDAVNQVGLNPFLSAVAPEYSLQLDKMIRISLNPFREKSPLDIVKVLGKSRMIDSFSRDTQERTALHLAVIMNDIEMVKYLVDTLQVSRDIKDKENKIPFQYCSPSSEIGIYLTNQERARSAKAITNLKPQNIRWRNAVFQGGSVKGIAYPAAIEQLEKKEKGFIENLERVGGASAGAITALLIGLGYTLDEMKHMMGVKRISGSDLPVLEFKSFLDGEYGKLILAAKNREWATLIGAENARIIERLRNIDGCLAGLARLLDGTVSQTKMVAVEISAKASAIYNKLTSDLGLCSGTTLRDLFEDLIRRKTKEKYNYEIHNATFKELDRIADFKKLYFIGVNLTTGERETFSAEDTPDMVVADAVRISMSIPGVFIPHPKVTKDSSGQLIKNKILYVDGGVLSNYPIDLFDFCRYTEEKCDSGERNTHDVNRATIGFRLVSPQLKKRYENMELKPLGETNTEGKQATGLLNHIKNLVSAIYHKQESDHACSGDGFRSIYIDTLDIGMLDFDKVEIKTVKKQLLREGELGVENFLNRRRTQRFVTLPEELKALVMANLESTSLILKADQVHFAPNRIRRNCPALVAKFYEAWQDGAIKFLHDDLGISLFERDTEENTAFHIAATYEKPEALKKLLAICHRGASIKNKKGEMPIVLARRHERHATEALLLSYMTENKIEKKEEQKTEPLVERTSAFSTASEHNFFASSLPYREPPLRHSSVTHILLPDERGEKATDDFYDIDVPSDGSCLFYSITLSLLLPVLKDQNAFHSIFIQLFGEENKTEHTMRETLRSYDGNPDLIASTTPLGKLVNHHFRSRLVNYMKEKKETYSIFFTSGQFEDEMKKMKDPELKAWGDEREISAASRFLQRKIIVYKKEEKEKEKQVKFFRSYGDEYKQNPLYLLHTWASSEEKSVKNHYHYWLPAHYLRPETEIKEKEITIKVTLPQSGPPVISPTPLSLIR